MRDWFLALVDAVWALSCVRGGCWADGWDWNDRTSSDGLRPRAR